MKKRGRKVKLSERDVNEIREAYADRTDKRCLSELARAYRVTFGTVNAVVMKTGAYKIIPQPVQ